MNKKNLCKQISLDTELSCETVTTVLESIEKIVAELLMEGGQLHWGGFLRAWTVLKAPTDSSGKPRSKDTKQKRFRYRLPCCTFGAGITRPMKEEVINLAEVPLTTGANDSR